MTTKTAFIRARVEPKLKKHVEGILKKFGITTTQLITMIYKHIECKKSIPLDLSIPNKETAKTIAEARKGKGLITCKNADDFFKQLGIE